MSASLGRRLRKASALEIGVALIFGRLTPQNVVATPKAALKRAQSRRWRESGRGGRTEEHLAFKASTVCESGVAAAALPPQSKVPWDYREGGRNCLRQSKAGAVGQVARQNGLAAAL